MMGDRLSAINIDTEAIKAGWAVPLNLSM